MHDQTDDEALLALLPWYANNRLNTVERAQVDALLQRSASAREALLDLQRLREAVQAAEQVINQEHPLPSEMGWARLQRSVQQAPAAPVRRDWWKPGLAVAALLMLSLQLTIVLRPVAPIEDWQLQSSGPAQQVLNGGYRVQLRFVEHAQWLQIRNLLLEVDARLIDGPTTLGMVQVFVPANPRFADGRAVLQWLQQQALVQHAALLGHAGQ